MQTIKATQFSDEDFFSTTINQDMMEILSSIRDAHMHDSTAADTTGADVVKNAWIRPIILKDLLKKPKLPCSWNN